MYEQRCGSLSSVCRGGFGSVEAAPCGNLLLLLLLYSLVDDSTVKIRLCNSLFSFR